MRKFCSWILKVWGWKITGEIPNLKKFIVIAAPHTSMWDFVIGRLFFYAIGKKPSVLIKRELFFFPLGYLLKGLGGIPVDRDSKTNITEQLVETFQKRDNFILAITPEGTRSKVSEWKKGFFNISHAAHIPIVPGYFDFKKKEIGIGDYHFAEPSFEEEMIRLKAFYENVTPKHPQKFSI